MPKYLQLTCLSYLLQVNMIIKSQVYTIQEVVLLWTLSLNHMSRRVHDTSRSFLPTTSHKDMIEWWICTMTYFWDVYLMLLSLMEHVWHHSRCNRQCGNTLFVEWCISPCRQTPGIWQRPQVWRSGESISHLCLILYLF